MATPTVTVPPGPPSPPGPSMLDALSLAAEAAEELVLNSARDTHDAWSRRAHGLTRRFVGRGAVVPETLHRGIAGAVYAGIGAGLRGASVGLDKLAETGVGPRLEDGPRGRFVSSAVNGLIGDKLLAERPQLAIPTAVRLDGRDVDLDPPSLAAAFPGATPKLLVLVHGLCENESYWNLHRERTGHTYAEALTAQGWTPVFLRVNTGLSVRENGAAVSALLQRLVDSWPVPATRIATIGHSLGGLVLRASTVVRQEHAERPWTDLLTDSVTLGTPHLGAPLAWAIGHGSTGLGWLPETAAFGRILDWRSVGVRDLVLGLGDDIDDPADVRYRLVSATLSTSPRHPIGYFVGDLLVRPASAHGRDRRGKALFPDAEVLHVGRTDHFGLLNHPDIHDKLREWLA